MFLRENGQVIPKELYSPIIKFLDSLFLDDNKDKNSPDNNTSNSFGEYLFDTLEVKIRETFPDRCDDPEFKSIVYGLFNWRLEITIFVCGACLT